MLPSVFFYQTSLDLMELQLCVIAISVVVQARLVRKWQFGSSMETNFFQSICQIGVERHLFLGFKSNLIFSPFLGFAPPFSTFACWLILIGKSLGIETGVVLCYSGQVIFGGTMSSFVQGQHDTTSSCDIVAFSCNSQSFGNGTGKQCIWYQS